MKKVVAFDTETRGLEWWNPDQRAFLASWADQDGEYVADLSDEVATAQFVKAITEADVLVGHNLSFDVHHVRAAMGLDVLSLDKELWDTDIMSRVLFPEGAAGTGFGHGLKDLAEKHLDPDAKKPEDHIAEMAKSLKVSLKSTPKAYYTVWRAYPEIMEEYARQDARYTWDLHYLFQKEVPKYPIVMGLECAVTPWIIRSEQIGVRVDQVPVLRLKAEYEKQAAELYEKITTELGEEAIGGKGSEQALLEALQMIGVPLYQRTETGQLATNKFALQEFQDDYPVIRDLFEWRTATKFLSTYIEPMVGREIVHTNFAQIGAWTGRMSSRRPNMQNIPNRAGKEVRSVFIPRDGYAFVVSDYDSIEARILAYYTGSLEYRRKLASGFDVHAEMASLIETLNPDGLPMESFLKGTPGQEQRDIAKNTTYAICYGAGGKRITDMNGLDPGRPLTEDDWVVQKGYKQVGEPSYEHGAKMARTIKANIPGFVKLDKRVKDKVKKVGYVNTIMGRKNPVNPDKAYVGLNGLIQGTAADIMKQGYVNTCEALAPLGGHVLLVVHDECLSEVPIDRAEEALELQNAAMCAAWPLDPPLAVSGAIVTTNYADAK